MTGPRPQAPASRRAGRALGRWWRQHRPEVLRLSASARARWATAIAYVWFVAYMWIGLVLSVAAERLTGVTSPYVLVTAVGGGALVGWWQARHRMRRHTEPGTPALRGFGLALCAWLGAIGGALLLTA